MWNVCFCPLQAADEQRCFSFKRAQREGHFRQHGILMVTKDEGGFTLFIHEGVGAQAHSKLLFVFSGQRQQGCPLR